MTKHRDRLAVMTAVALVLAVATLVVVTVLQAERNGRKALEKLQVSQTEQLARSMDARVKQIFTAFQGFAAGWEMTLRSKADLAKMQQLQDLNPNARAGFLLVDEKGVVLNGTLLRDPATVGTTLDREGLAGVLAGTPAILPVGPGVTTPLPTVGIAYPVRDTAGAISGAFVVESDVSSTSAFNEEVSQLRRGNTGEFTFIDANGRAVASSDSTMLGRPLQGLPTSAGLYRRDGQVVVVEPVPSASWRAVFRQDTSEFEGALTRPLRSALLLVVIAGVLAAGVIVVTLARRLERAREEQRRLQEINAAREEFISIVSHELRTPVVGLLGFLQTTLDHWEGMGESERRRAVSRGLASARRLHSLTRDVLDSSTLESGHLSYRFDVIDVRSEVATAVMAMQEVQPNRTVTLTTPDDPMWVRADPERMQQVLTNLLDNAAKSSPPYASIEVVVEHAGNDVRVDVVDHGPGLSEEERSRVFEKFVRGRSSTTQGTGLGLYICRRIVEAHGGTIEAQSGEEGSGATFEVTLPLVAAPAEPVNA